MSSQLTLPPSSELFSLKELASRHPKLLPENRLRWAARNRHDNGLDQAHAVYVSPVGELIFHEPSTLSWLLGLSGRQKPRAQRKERAKPSHRSAISAKAKAESIPA